MEDRISDLVRVCYLCLSRLGPDYEGVELGLGDQLLMKAIGLSTGRTVAKIKADIHELGDIGLVAAASKSTQHTVMQPPPLTLFSLYRGLWDVSKESGLQAVTKKVDIVRGLLSACRKANEAKFLFRLLSGKLRVGMAGQTILVALAHAANFQKNQENEKEENEQAVEVIKAVYNSLPNYELLVDALVRYGIRDLPKHCHMTPGIPMKPMLAHPTKAISEVLDRFEGMPFTCEYKYDGERAQIHYIPAPVYPSSEACLGGCGNVAIFSRNGEAMLQKYPDIAANVPQYLAGKSENPDQPCSFVLDCEIVAVDRSTGKLLPFQVLSTRKRKVHLPVNQWLSNGGFIFFVFDYV